MKKGCLLWLLQFAVLSGLYYLALRGRIPPPAVWLGALGGGLALSLVIGAFRNAGSARRGRALIDRALTGAPFEDGRRIAAIGPTLALGAPVPAPFSGTPCVFCSWEISHRSTVQTRKSRERVKDFGGFLMTPCVVETPNGNVRILGFPVLEGFPEGAQRGGKAFDRARTYLGSASFENVGLTNVFSEVKDLIADEDGYIRKDWRMAGGDFRLDPNVHTLTEQTVEDGQTVCALGLYSAEKAALVPGYGQGGEGIKLIQGDPETARKTLAASFWRNAAVGLLLFLLSHFLLYLFVVTR